MPWERLFFLEDNFAIDLVKDRVMTFSHQMSFGWNMKDQGKKKKKKASSPGLIDTKAAALRERKWQQVFIAHGHNCGPRITSA